MTARHDVTRRDRTRGLTSREARDRLVHDGPNVLPDTNRRNLAREFVRQLTHLLALLL